MTSRDKNLYNIAHSQDEFPYVITYKEGVYRLHSTNGSRDWTVRISNGKSFSPGIKHNKDVDAFTALIRLEDAAFIIHEHDFVLIQDGLESSGSAIQAIVESIANGTYVPRKSRVTSKPVNTFAFEVKIKKTYTVVIMGHTITVTEGAKYNKLTIQPPHSSNHEEISIPVELMVPIAQLFTEII